MAIELQCYVAELHSYEARDRICDRGMFIVVVEDGRRSKIRFSPEQRDHAREYVATAAARGFSRPQVAQLERCLDALERGEYLQLWCS